jgi:hypothetical protein
VGRTLVPPSPASGRETGLVAGWRQCTICPVHAVTAQALPPYGVLHRVGAVAQLPGPMSVLPVHVERRKLSVRPGLRHPQAVCCGARARARRRVRCICQACAEDVFPWFDYRYPLTGTSLYELLLHKPHPLGFTFYTERARTCIYRVSMLQD